MYDHCSRFNPTPTSPLPPSPSRPATPLNNTSSSCDALSSVPLPAASEVETPIVRSLYLSSSNRHTLNKFTARYKNEQKRYRADTWLPESQIRRQFKRVVWKVQTREERLVMDLNVVRAVLREMVRAVEGAEVGLPHPRGTSPSEAVESGERRFSESRWCGVFGEADDDEDMVWRVADARMKRRVLRHLERWKEFVEREFGDACDGAMDCRSHTGAGEAYQVLAKVVSIRPTATDKLWFEDLPSMGERVGLGGLKLLGARAKAVVWATAEVYHQFKAEEDLRLLGRRCEPEAETSFWIDTLLVKGAFLCECGLIEVGVDDETLEQDDSVVTLCATLEHLSIGPPALSIRRSKRRLIKNEVERVWREAFGFVREGCTGS